jgi:hypothetical protein
MVAFILSFPLRVGVWFCPHRCRLRTFVRELVTAPKLRIRPHRVAVVLTTRVTGDLRLLRILAIDSGTISAHRSGDVAVVKIRVRAGAVAP